MKAEVRIVHNAKRTNASSTGRSTAVVVTLHHFYLVASSWLAPFAALPLERALAVFSSEDARACAEASKDSKRATCFERGGKK